MWFVSGLWHRFSVFVASFLHLVVASILHFHVLKISEIFLVYFGLYTENCDVLINAAGGKVIAVSGLHGGYSKRAYVTFLAGAGDYVKGVVGLVKGLFKTCIFFL